MHSLPLFMKLEGRPVILLGKGDAAAAKRRLLERAGADIQTNEDAQAALAVVAIEDERQALAVIASLKARGVLVNAVDRPTHCDFTLPAIVDRDPVLIAIGTGGASAGLAKALRQRLEALLPASLGALAEALGKARTAMRTRWPEASSRRRAIDAGLAEGGPLDPLTGADAAMVERWLGTADSKERAAPRLHKIVITSDDPDELTLRAARHLGQADVVFHAPGVAPAILDRARADATRVSATHRPDWAGPGLALWLHREDDK
ncbi:MAG: NAD(P)-dependent oxidoreductase [Sphingomonadaceae bacterium]|jgi:uroporphyrin-III C-methyltransferase/precorrin-2 dehydrogenase/sirohydrochlorin ferrochelatase